MSKSRRRDRGFSLMELIMVVTVLSILVSILAVKVTDGIRKAKEGATLGNLGAIRSALSIYYADQGTTFPSTVGSLTVGGQYLKAIPPTSWANYHQDTAVVKEGPGSSAIDDSGGWAYDNDPNDADFGKIWVNCTHTDIKGSSWTTY